LHDEGNLVRILARDGPKHAKGGSNGVAAAFDGQLDDILAVEVIGIFREAGAAGMLDALVHRQNGHVASAAQAAVAEQALEISEHAQVAVARRINAINKIRTGKMHALLDNFG